MPGHHLPYLAAAADGLFAEYGLDVDVLDPASGPENVRRVATGGSEFCLTSVGHYLTARERYGDLPARFVSAIVQRHPISGLVAAESDFHTPADLSGRRVGGSGSKGLLAEYQAALEQLGLERGEVVESEYGDAPAALARGDIDALPDFVDLVPRTSLQSGMPVRAIHFGINAYGHGLVAGDDVDLETVRLMQDGLVAALERQRQDPTIGLDILAERYPDADPGMAVDGWEMGEPGIFTGAPVGSSTPEGWASTISFLVKAHGGTALAPESVYRPEAIRSPEEARA
jgi:NitT/TauT family transport system substrate-binding protein